MHIELRQLKYFLAIVECGSFSKAAETVGLTQSALSRSIQALEAAVDGTLLDRTRGEIVPTDLGLVVLRHAKHLDSSVDDLRHDIGLSKGLELGVLRIGVGPWGGSALVGPVIGRLNHLYPKLHIETIVAPWQELPERARGRDLDLIVLSIAQVQLQDDFEVKVLQPHPHLLVCRPGHPLAEASVSGLRDLLAYPLAGPTMERTTLLKLTAGLPVDKQSAMADKGLISIVCDSGSILKDVLTSSNAISLMPRFMVAKDLESGQLAQIKGTDLGLRTTFGAAWLKHRTPSAAAREFVVLLQEYDKSISQGSAV